MGDPARIYTRTGDDGTTGLVGGERVSKADLRIVTYGAIDETSSHIGVARAALSEVATLSSLEPWLSWVQDRLFNLGSELATPHPTEATPRIVASDVAALERAIDATQEQLPPLTAFIHPGGSPIGAALHVARVVTRRAEQSLVGLAAVTPIEQAARDFLNRLSDALFVWARWVNHRLDRPEHRWSTKTPPPG